MIENIRKIQNRMQFNKRVMRTETKSQQRRNK